jgi:hypothetical protein
VGGNLLVGDLTNNANPYILPTAAGVYLRLGNSTTPIQDVNTNYVYAGGKIRIGSFTSPAAVLDVAAGITGSGVTNPNSFVASFQNTNSANYSDGILVNLGNGATNGNRYMEVLSNGSEQGCLYGGGANGNGGGFSMYSSSYRRLKTNIRPTGLGLQQVMKMQIRDYDWKSNGNTVNAGFIAQELYEAYPQAVIKGSDGDVLDSKTGGTWMVNYAGITPLLAKAIQDQQHLIEGQKQEIEALKAKNEMLQSQNSKVQSDVDKLKASVESLQQIVGAKAQK